MKLNRRHIT